MAPARRRRRRSRAAALKRPVLSSGNYSLGCRLFCMAAFHPSDFRREGLAVSPNSAVTEKFLFPDRNGALQRVNEPSAGFKGRATMWRCHDDEHARLSDIQAAQTMHDSHFSDAKFCQTFFAEPLQFLQGHGLIRFILEVHGLASARVVADHTFEYHRGAVLGTL